MGWVGVGWRGSVGKKGDICNTTSNNEHTFKEWKNRNEVGSEHVAVVPVNFGTALPTRGRGGWPSSSLQPCQTPAAPCTDLSRSPRAPYTKALFLRTRTAALPTASPAPGMDFPATQTALCLRPDPPTPWTPPLAMAFHLRSVPCFQTDDVLDTRTKQAIPPGSGIMNCQI